jgi:uncharacterized membrane protein YidH (DUF202 family)
VTDATNEGPPSTSRDRTTLAWQRTAFSLLAGAAVLSRLTIDRLGAASLVAFAVTALLLLWVVTVAVGLRGRERGRDGRAAAALTAGIVLVGLTELAALALNG